MTDRGTATGDDPFAVLGLPWTATLDQVRDARRRLALDTHPDRGGDLAAMQRVNAAFDACVGHVTHRRPLVEPRPASAAASPPPPSRPARHRRPVHRAAHVEQDAPSFTVDALPAEAFEAMLVVAAWIGEVLDDDPPYVLECHLHEPAMCWCRLDLVPDAGGSTVSLTVVTPAEAEPVSAEVVRDLWVDQLNRLGPQQP